jgi:hypothetical protein
MLSEDEGIQHPHDVLPDINELGGWASVKNLTWYRFDARNP